VLFSFRKKFRCCFCKENFSKFDPFGIPGQVFQEKKIIGGGYRKNARCPKCKSIDRERHVFLYLEKKTSVLKDNLKLLHVAPENRLRNSLQECKNLDYVTANLNKKNVAVKMDIRNIQFEDNYFDVIICNHVLEHIDDDKKAMDELYRILKPRGFAILQVPISYVIPKTYENPKVITPEQREREFGQFNHVRLYGKDYGERLTVSGFTLEKWNFSKSISKDEGKKFGLIENEDLFIVRK